jgi:N-acetylmuramoyl-L-alanine amidase
VTDKHGNVLTEWVYNLPVAEDLAVELGRRGLDAEVVHRPATRLNGRSPYLQMIDAVNELGPLVVVSLHCNASEDPKHRGMEVLHYAGSRAGAEFAECLRKEMRAALPFRDRGLKPRGLEDRGGPFLGLTNMPAVIPEPFFLTNSQDRRDGIWYRSIYIDALADGIEAYLRSIGAVE